MSLLRLHSFLKENSHDIKDYWIMEGVIKFVRVVSRKNGHIYFVRLSELKIKVPEDHPDIFEKSNFYYMEKSHHEHHESLDTLYDVFLCAFPEYNYRYLLFKGYYMMQEKDMCYQIRNMSDTDYFGFYLFLDIEWFFENTYIVSHEIEKIMTDIQTKTEKMYQGFLPSYHNFCGEKDITKVNHVWDYYLENQKEFRKCTLLYKSICDAENSTIHDIEFNEKISDSDDLQFKEVVRRGYQKKALGEKLDKILHLKSKSMERMIFYHCIEWKILLKFLVLISKFTKLQSDFHNMVYELESVVPKSRITYFSK
jgi:hypothetical protein